MAPAWESESQVSQSWESREGLQAVSQLRVAVAEAGNRLGTLREQHIHCWKPLPSSTVKTMTENTGQCVIVIFKV
jgi:hypothetical protein